MLVDGGFYLIRYYDPPCDYILVKAILDGSQYSLSVCMDNLDIMFYSPTGDFEDQYEWSDNERALYANYINNMIRAYNGQNAYLEFGGEKYSVSGAIVIPPIE